ncbi:MAG: hypothetical protein IPK10_03395 [Bacteroidetes bacterium]|nr:hypothetical protein [Bacteroidota bacterium]
MKKGKFRFIVISMSIALAGLILCGPTGSKHDFESKAKQFDGTVMMAMNKIVEQVEEIENRRLVINNFISLEDSNMTFVGLNDSLLHIISSIAMEPPMPPSPPSPPNAASQLNKAIDKKFGDKKIFQRSWTPDGELSFLQLDSNIDIRIEKNIEQKEIIDLSFDRRGN